MQAAFTSFHQYIRSIFSNAPFRQFLTRSFYLGSFLSLSVYTWVRILLFHELPVETGEEILLIVRIIFAGWMLAASCIGGFTMLLFVVDHHILVYKKALQMKWRLAMAAGVIFVGFLTGCNGVSASIKKDLNTGMVTTTKNLSVNEAKLVMNKEVINHTDIPLGESFYIINEGVKGLTVQNGKVSVGCSLLITDSAGKVLLSEPDLFKGNDIFEKDSADFLRCKVNTGKPMNWEEKYNIAVVFTDKYGKGNIENKVVVRMIDLP